MSSSGDAAERAVFKRACAVLAELQDDMDWKNVMSKFKVTAAKWAKSLKKIERQVPIEVGTLWILTRRLCDVIKPTSMLPSWSQPINGQPQASTDWWRNTDHTSARAVLRAICILRAHTLNLQFGPAFALDGTPLPTTYWPDPAAWLSAPGPAAAAVSVAPLLAPVHQQSGLCGVNGCPLTSGHGGLCVIVSLETRRKVQQPEFLAPEGCVAGGLPPPDPRRVAGSLPPPETPPAAVPAPAAAPATATVPVTKRKADAASYVVLPAPTDLDLPPGWSVEVRETAAGRKYSVYSCAAHAQCNSLKEAWKKHLEPTDAAASRPQQLTGEPAQARQRPKQLAAGLAASSAALSGAENSGQPKPPTASTHTISEAEAKLRSVALINRANEHAQANDFAAAQQCYSELLDALPRSSLNASRRAFHLANRAFVRVKLGRFSEALADADAALNLNDRRPTTYWRKVQALDGLEQTHQADALATAALTLADVKKQDDKFFGKLQERATRATRAALGVASVPPATAMPMEVPSVAALEVPSVAILEVPSVAPPPAVDWKWEKPTTPMEVPSVATLEVPSVAAPPAVDWKWEKLAFGPAPVAVPSSSAMTPPPALGDTNEPLPAAFRALGGTDESQATVFRSLGGMDEPSTAAFRSLASALPAPPLATAASLLTTSATSSVAAVVPSAEGGAPSIAAVYERLRDARLEEERLAAQRNPHEGLLRSFEPPLLRLPFSKEEQDELRRGVHRHGTSSWAVILREGSAVFPAQRSNVDLKDKWRNMAKQGEPYPVDMPIRHTELPPGWTCDTRERTTGGLYKVYTKPGEKRCQSLKQAWEQHLLPEVAATSLALLIGHSVDSGAAVDAAGASSSEAAVDAAGAASSEAAADAEGAVSSGDDDVPLSLLPTAQSVSLPTSHPTSTAASSSAARSPPVASVPSLPAASMPVAASELSAAGSVRREVACTTSAPAVGAPRVLAPPMAVTPAAMPPPAGRPLPLSQARHELLEIEDAVDMDHINGFMQKNLHKWRHKVKKATTPKDLATHMREFRQCMLDEYKGRPLFGRGYAKGLELHAQWRTDSTRTDITVEALHALLLQLWRSYTLSGPNDTFNFAPSMQAKRATEKPRALPPTQSRPAAESASTSASASASERGKVAPPAKPAPQPQRVPDTRTAPQSKAGASAAQRPPQSEASTLAGGKAEMDDLVSDVLVSGGQQSEMARKRLVKGGASSQLGAALSSAENKDSVHWKEAARWPLEQILPLRGARLELWWAGNRTWFAGKVADIEESTGKVLVKYNDGDWKWHKLWQEAIREVKLKQPKVPKQPTLPPTAAPARQPAVAASSEQVSKKKRPLPTSASAPATAQGAQAARSAKQAAAARPVPQPSMPPASVHTKASAKGAVAGRKADLPASSTKPTHTHAAPARAPPARMPPLCDEQRTNGPRETPPLQARNVTDSKPRPIGKKTQPPRYLKAEADGGPCSCVATAQSCCQNDRCSKYDYYDAMRMTTDFGHGGIGSSRGLVSFSEGTGMLMRDAATLENPDPLPMVGELGSVRKHRTSGRVECLARWFIRASDRALVGHAPALPEALVYRVGGETQDSWQFDWCDAESVLGKCKTTYAPPAVISQHCERVVKRGWRSEFFFDSHIEFDQKQFVFRPPRELPQSKRVQDAVGTAQPTAAQMAAAESSSDDDEQAPLSRRAVGAGVPKRQSSAGQRAGPQAGPGQADDAKRYRIKRKPGQVSPPLQPSSRQRGEDDAAQQLPWMLPSNASSAIHLDLPEMTAENEATDGADFEHLVRPQPGDSFAGALYELGLARHSAAPSLATPEVTTAELASLASPRGATSAQRDLGRRLSTPARPGAWEWGVATVPKQLRRAPQTPRAPFDNGDSFRPYMGRFFPVLLTRLGADGRQRYLQGREPPQMCAAVDCALREASGKGRPAYAAIKRGLALEPMLGMPASSLAWPRKGSAENDQADDMVELERQMFAGRALPVTLPTDQLRRKLHSDKRFVLNGMFLNRFKYTTYSRHFTSHRVLEAIAGALQPHLQPGDTFVDFACGANTFAPLLRDPGSGEALNAVAFDIFSPVDRTEHFTRTAWLQVDAERDLPPGELVMGLNPPFGHQNRIAIDFVEHALCARPRLIVLIMPSTNYEPPGYELVERDEQLCRGNVFYTPGHSSSNIDAKNVKPNFLLYRRKQEVAPPRACLCHHVRGQLRVSRSRANQRQINEIKLKRKADAQAYALAGLPSADLWPFVATRGPQAGQQQPAPLAWMRQVAPAAPPGSLGSAQKRKAEATADLRQKLRRTQ